MSAAGSASTLLASRIEDAGLNASAPPEQRWLDGWLLRFSPGKAKRARCINAVADGRLPLGERLQHALALYREVGLPPLLRVTPFTLPTVLEDHVSALGWQRLDDTRVMLLPDLQQALRGRPAGADALPTPQPLTALELADLVGMLRGSPAVQRQAHARRLLAAPVPFQGFVLRDGEVVLACGQFAREAELVGLYDVITAPHARERGLGGALCHWLLTRAAAEGARHAYLQVEADNAGARSVYERLGFTDAYRYHYRAPEPEIV
ncbi:MAG: GNAT family N-acetyltransferase [Rubrivivax sp.]